MVGPHLVILASGLQQWGSQLVRLGSGLATALRLTFKAVMGPPMQLLLAIAQAVGHFLLPLWQVSQNFMRL